MPALALVCAASILAQELLSRKVNVPPGPVSSSRIGQALLSPDGARVVFLADLVVNGRSSLYSAPVDGSLEAIRLDGVDSQSSVDLTDFYRTPFAITPDSQRVVWIGNRVSSDAGQLFSAPIDGSEPAERLHALMPDDMDVIEFALSADSTRVAFVVESPTHRFVLVTGVSGHGQVDVLASLPGALRNLAIDPSSTRVVIAADHLYSVPLDGSSGAIILSNPQNAGFGRLAGLAPDGIRAFYVASDPAYPSQLFSVPIDGSAPAVGVMPGIRIDLHRLFHVSPDSARYVFSGSAGIVSGPSDGSSPGTVIAGYSGDIESSTLTTDGGSLVYEAGSRIWRVALDGSGTPLPLDHGWGVSEARYGRDELAYLNTNQRLFGAAYDGSGGVLLEPGPLNQIFDFLIQAQGGQIAFTRQLDALSGGLGVWRVPALDPGGLFPIDTRAEEFDLLQISSGTTGSVLYRRRREIQELWATRLDGTVPPVQISPQVVGTRLTGDVKTYEVVWPYVVYEEEVPAPYPQIYPSRLLVARLDQRGTAVECVPLDALRVSASKSWWVRGSSVIFVGRLPGDTSYRLCRVPLDLSTPMQAISGSHTFDGPAASVWAPPTSTHVIFASDTAALVSVPVDGSTIPVVLSATYAFYRDVTDDGRAVVFDPASRSASIVPVDGSGPAQPVVATHATNRFLPTLGDYLPYLQDLDSDRLQELHLVELSSGIDRVHDEQRFLDGFLEASMRLSGGRLVYIANTQSASTTSGSELFSVPLDASAAPTRLNGPLISGGAVRSFLVLDDETLIYLAEQDQPRDELYRVPADGSRPPTRLIASIPAGETLDSFELSPDQQTLAIVLRRNLGFPGSDSVYSLYSLPAAGGSLVELGQPRVSGGLGAQEGGFEAGDIDFLPDSSELVFSMDREVVNRFELYRQPLDAQQEPRRLSRHQHPFGSCSGVTALPQGILYMSDGDIDDVVELYFVTEAGKAPDSKSSSAAPTGTATRTQ